MERLTFCDPYFKTHECCICIGVFDGMHVGHGAIFERCVSEAKDLGIDSVCVSFSRNPKIATGSMAAAKPLSSDAEMDKVLAKYGFDYHCVIDFSDDMSKLSGWDFMTLLCTSYSIMVMVAGSSFRCGCKASQFGPAEISGFLEAHRPGSRFVTVPSVFIEGEEVSSTLVRRSILSGEMAKAAVLLGRPYEVALPLPSAIGEDGLRLEYDCRAIGQLLPCDGVYDVDTAGLATAADHPVPAGCKAVLVVSGGVPALNLQVRMIPERISFLQEGNHGYKGTEAGDYRQVRR